MWKLFSGTNVTFWYQKLGLHWLTAGLLAVIAGFFLLPTQALADLPKVPDDTAEANGRVSKILRVGDRIYLGGGFTQLTNPDGTTIARNSLAAIDANTGRVVTDWNPNATIPGSPNSSSVRTIALSSDGSRLFIGGTFTNVGGVTRPRLAAINTATGALDRQWSAPANATVWTLAVSGGSVYAGGNFTTLGGSTRTHLAKLDATTGAVDPNWTPSADGIHSVYGSVRELEFFADGGRLYAGGYFGSISGQQTGNLVALDPATGAVDGGFRPNDRNGIMCMEVSGGRVFVGTGDDLEGVEAFDAVTGNRDWYLGYGSHAPPEGDVQAMTMSGDTLYVGGHFNRLHDQTKYRLAGIEADTGIVDSQWTPTVNGAPLGVWAMDSYGPKLYVGGDFSGISGQAQAGFAQFTDGPDLPDKGLTGTYFDNIDFTGPELVRTDATINYDWGNFSPSGIDPNTFSSRWIGQVQPAYSQTYTFYTYSDDGVRLWVNGQLIIDNWTDHGPTENSGQITLTTGQKYDIRMEHYENQGGATAKLSWSSPSQAKQIVPQFRLYPASDPASDCTVTGTAGDDVLEGSAEADVICGGGGNDSIKGLGGNDVLKGEGGSDKLYGGDGDDRFEGGIGTDLASYSSSATAVSASLLTNGASGEGSDTLVDVENLEGSNQADTLTGSEASNRLTGLNGTDSIIGLDGNDIFLGGAGNDELRGGVGNDSITGGGNADLLYGEDGDDTLDSRDNVSGNDSLDGGTHINGDACLTDATEKSVTEC